MIETFDAWKGNKSDKYEQIIQNNTLNETRDNRNQCDERERAEAATSYSGAGIIRSASAYEMRDQ